MDEGHNLPVERAVIADRNGREEPPSLFHFANALIRNRRILIVLPLVLAVAAVLLSMSQPRQYRAAASFVPTSSGEESQLQNFAQQFGMRLNASTRGQSPAFYSALVVTRDILQDVVRTEYRVTTGEGERTADLIHLYGYAETEGGGPGRTPLDYTIEELRASMAVFVDYESGLVRLGVSAPYPELAEQIAARIIQLTQEFDLTKRRTQASARRRFSEERLNEASTELRQSQVALERFVASNRLYAASPVLAVEYGKLVHDLGVKQQVHLALVQSYEQARIDEVRDTPVITVVESPEGSAAPVSRGTVLKALFAIAFGLLVALIVALFRETGRRARGQRSREFEEFVELRSEALQGLGRLTPWRTKRRLAGRP